MRITLKEKSIGVVNEIRVISNALIRKDCESEE